MKKISCKDKNHENKASFFCSKHFPYQQSYIAFIGFILYKTNRADMESHTLSHQKLYIAFIGFILSRLIGQAWNYTKRKDFRVFKTNTKKSRLTL